MIVDSAYDSELWAPVPGYEGAYEVSTLGRVRSVARVVEGRWGLTRRAGGLLALHRANGRYFKVSLCRDGKLTQHQVHRLVLLAFVGKPPAGFVCDHIDHDISNNRLTNLQWLSAVDNSRKKANAKLSAEVVARIKQSGLAPSCIAKEYGISERHARSVLTGYRWKGVS